MDLRWSPLPLDSMRAVTVHLYAKTTTPAQIAAGAAELIELTPFVERNSQGSANEVTVTLSWHNELDGANQPRPAQPLAVKLGGVILWQGIIDSVNDYRLRVGERKLSITARSRDATPAWREVPRITTDYPQGTQIDLIARDVVSSGLGLEPEEILLPSTGVYTPQSSTQLAQIPAWTMLEQLLIPAGLYPYVDGLGRLRAYSRDVTRDADIVLTDDRIKSINGSKSAPAITRLQLKWRDPNLARVTQQERELATATVTAGFFQSHQRQNVYWSEDRTQRALGTRLVVKQSANSGLIPNLVDEDYAQFGDDGSDEVVGGRITLTTNPLVLASLAIFLAVEAAAHLPDIAPPGGGATTPAGKIVQGAAELTALLILAGIGTGMYEVWGVPFDDVNPVNTTEVYDDGAPEWASKLETIETDFIANESHAQTVAGREFLYRALGAVPYNVTIVDDPRIERGDILELADGSRLYVTDYSRDLSYGAAAELAVMGFRV